MSGLYDKKLKDGEGGRQLIIKLPSTRRVMEYQIEMIAKNNVPGLLSFRYLTADGKPCFNYDTAGFVTFDEYIRSYGQNIRFLAGILMEISVTIGSLEIYLLEEKCLLLETGLLFVDPVRLGVKLVYLPEEPPEDKRASFPELVIDIIGGFHPEDATSKLFCKRIIEEVKKAGFRYEAFTDFLLDILCFSDDKQNNGGTYQRQAGFAPGDGDNIAGGMQGFGSNAGSADFAGSGGSGGGASGIGDSSGASCDGRGRGRRKGRRGGWSDGGGRGRNGGSSGRGNGDRGSGGGGVRGNVGSGGNGIGGGGGVKNSVKSNDDAQIGFFDRFKPRIKVNESAVPKDNKILMSVLAATAVVVAYFGILSFIPRGLSGASAYKSAVLLAALGAEMLLMKHFLSQTVVPVCADGKKADRGGEFADAVRAASAIHKASMAAENDLDDFSSKDLWANSVNATQDDMQPNQMGDMQPNQMGDMQHNSMDNMQHKPMDNMQHNPLNNIQPNPMDDMLPEPLEPPDIMQPISQSLIPPKPQGIAPHADALPASSANRIEAEELLDEYLSKMQFEYFRDAFQDDENSDKGHMPGVFDEKQMLDYPPTEVLSFSKHVDATLLIRDAMREFGVSLTQNEFTIGRKKELSDLVLDNPAVGKAHAKLEKDDEYWYVRDMNSRNGTYLNNIKLESGGRKELHNSDLITIANVDMLFCNCSS